MKFTIQIVTVLTSFAVIAVTSNAQAKAIIMKLEKGRIAYLNGDYKMAAVIFGELQDAKFSITTVTRAEILFEKTKTALEQDRFQNAAQYLEEIKSINPSSREANYLRERVGVEFIISIIDKGDRFKAFANWFLSTAMQYDEDNSTFDNLEMSEKIARVMHALSTLKTYLILRQNQLELDDSISPDQRKRLLSTHLIGLTNGVNKYLSIELYRVLSMTVAIKDELFSEAVIEAISANGSEWVFPRSEEDPPADHKWLEHWLLTGSFPENEWCTTSCGAWPLLEALSHPSDSIRHAAAKALMNIHNRSWFIRHKKFPRWKLFLRVLMEALYETEE